MLRAGTKKTDTNFNSSQISHNNDLLEDTNVGGAALGQIGPNPNFEISKDFTKKGSKASLSQVPSHSRIQTNQGSKLLNKQMSLKNLGGPISELDQRMKKDADLL